MQYSGSRFNLLECIESKYLPEKTHLDLDQKPKPIFLSLVVTKITVAWICVIYILKSESLTFRSQGSVVLLP